MEKVLKDKVVVITGSGRGIGREMALLMARSGAKVVVNDIGGTERGEGLDQVPAMEVVAEIHDSGGQAKAQFGSVTSYESAENIINTDPQLENNKNLKDLLYIHERDTAIRTLNAG